MWVLTETACFNLDNCMCISWDYDRKNNEWARITILGSNGEVLYIAEYKTKEEASKAFISITTAIQTESSFYSIEEDRLWPNGKK